MVYSHNHLISDDEDDGDTTNEEGETSRMLLSNDDDDDDSSDVSLTSDSEDDSDNDAEDDEEMEETDNERYKELALGREQNKDDDDEEDEVIKKIKQCKELHKEGKLTEIKLDDTCHDISFHTGENIIAAADINGDIFLYSYTDKCAELKCTLEIHTDSVRSIEFTDDGDNIISGSKDMSIAVHDVQTEKLVRNYDNAHDDPVNIVAVISEHIFASGTDNGEVKIWDIRSKSKELFKVKGMDDFVTSMVSTDKHKYLACTCGDGSVVSINLTARKLHIQSEFYKAELTCSAVVKGDSKLACGSADGSILLYNWGEFGTSSDIIAKYGPKKVAVNCMVPVTDKIIICGYENGEIRATNTFPMKHLGIVGQHSLSVESLDISHDGEYIASCSLDNTINFWPIEYFEKLKVKTEKIKKRQRTDNNLPSSKFSNASDFFSGLTE